MFCSLLIMPQTVSPVDPIPSPPSAKIPAGGTLCERAGTPVPLWHAGTALLCPKDRQGGRQPGWEWRGARALSTQEEDPGEGGDSRLLGRDASSLTQLQRGVEAGGLTPHDLVSDQARPSPRLLVQQLPDGTVLSHCALGKTLLQQLPNEVLVSVPRMRMGVVNYPAAAGLGNQLPCHPSTQSSHGSLLFSLLKPRPWAGKTGRT